MAKPGPKPKQFCPYGHDTFICGRNKISYCKDCVRIRNAKRPKHPRIKTSICINGHDKDITGRTSSGTCRICHNERSRLDPTKDSRLKQFCPKGHDTFVTGRYASNRGCIRCMRKEIKQKCGNKPGIPIKQICKRGHDLTLPDAQDKYGACILCQKERWIKNKEKMQAQRKKRAVELKKYWQEYAKAHPEKSRAAKAKRRAILIQSSVVWCQTGIADLYKNCPTGMHVDHIIPLQHKKVQGLHVIWNLQYLTASANCSKKNIIDLVWASEWYGKILEEAGLK
jgi:hypothetical protein